MIWPDPQDAAVCHLPENLEFHPILETKGPPIVMTLDEFETIRLIDKEGLSQKECGENSSKSEGQPLN